MSITTYPTKLMTLTKKAKIFLAEGFEETEALVTGNLLGRAGVSVELVAIGSELAVRSSRGITVMADSTLADGLGDYDLLILPGGMPGASNLNECAPLRAELTKAYESGKLVAAICAAPLVFGSLGILNGRRATCYPGFEEQLTGATATGELVVVDGNVITGKGPAAATPFGLKLAELLTDAATAQRVKEQICLS